MAMKKEVKIKGTAKSTGGNKASMPKRPTGELPKRNSQLAKFIGKNPTNKLTMAEARVAAGKYRDAEKKAGGFKGIGFMDMSGAALGKAIKKTQKPVKKMGK
jgi:hypothetical protein